jgi:O-antigen/teichoic acid export membrane protein
LEFLQEIDFSQLLQRAKDSILYFGAAIILLPISIFTSPLFAKNLSAYDFSAIGYFSAVMSFFLPIINLSFYSYYMLDYFKRNEEERRDILRSLVSFLLLFNIFVVSLGYLILHFYLKTTSSQFVAFPLGLIVLLTGVASLGRSFWLLRLRFEHKSTQYFILSVIFSLLNVGLGILFVVYYKMGATGRLIPALIIDFIIFCIFFTMFIKKINVDITIVKKAFHFSLPVILSALLNLPVLALDKILLERVNNISEFAYYNIAFGFAGYVYTFINAIAMTLEPDVYKFVGERDKRKIISMFCLLSIAVIFADVSFIIFSEPIIHFLTAGRYMGSVKYANLLVISQSCLALVYFLGSVLTALKLTRLEFVVMVIVALISVGSLISLISSFEFFGAIYSKILTYLIWFGLFVLAIVFRNSKFMQPFYVR